MTRPASRQYTRSVMPMISGMSCSITSIAAPSSALDAHDQRAERLGFALRDAAGRLVEQQHPRVDREQRAELDDAAGAGREVRRRTRRRSGRGRGSRSSSAASARLRRSAPGDGGRPVIDGTSHECSRASSATMIVSRTVSAGIQPRRLEAAAEPDAGAAGTRAAG